MVLTPRADFYTRHGYSLDTVSVGSRRGTDFGHIWVEAVEPIHFDRRAAVAGLAASFARTMADRNPSARIGLNKDRQ